MAYIYKIINNINNKVYIGQTAQTVDTRWKRHLIHFSDGRDTPLYHAMKKYGVENFSIETIEECNIEELDEKEKFYIKLYNSYGQNGYNATLGGSGHTLIDRDLVINEYLKSQSVREVAKICGCRANTVSTILKGNNIPILSNVESMVNKVGKSVSQYSLSGDFIQSFTTTMDAARWIVENGYSSAAPKGVGNNICSVCNGKRHFAYGFKWRREEN